MGNCLPFHSGAIHVSKKKQVLPVETIFKLPSPLPAWPQGEGFASGSINLGGLEVCQVSTFNKIWATQEGGPDNLGATFFEPAPLPSGYFMLGCYCQANNTPLFGWVLAGKDEFNASSSTLQMPVDYKLVWSSESSKIKQDGSGYIWLPIPPDGYKAVGHVVTNSSVKPSLDKIRCVRSDLTEDSQHDEWIWSNSNGINIYGMKPTLIGTHAPGVCVGTFTAQVDGVSPPITLSCLKNNANNLSSMPNLSQIQALVQNYSPWIYLHPDEPFLPSSVNWFFTNGALLYKKGEESNPIPIDATGSNLPQGGSNDDTYWLDLPIDGKAKDRVKKGDLSSAGAYIHVKTILGATYTDIAIWPFYPFNGAARAKVEFINVSLGKIGEHVGDWEHVTLRISNFTGELWRVFFSEHSGGTWIDASQLEFEGGNKVVTYASLHGHAFYSKPGLVLQGNTKIGIGIRNDTAKSKIVMDTGVRYEVVSAEYLGNAVVEPAWLNYYRKWGPKIDYDLDTELKKIEKFLPGKLKREFEKIVKSLPNELLGEDGPTGPKMKNNWSGDEV
ncbi:vacuolar sorting-associated protein [Thalictrum thalictroides]|uniref:Vacuolar sorting-associated protein n=1 Tax=Thalictrum thalictroides TaxID=46969 RepID=A0A7J6VVI0_THATH|nr:vacuolar sorting-associated protein [Thalictrum thalictroides]